MCGISSVRNLYPLYPLKYRRESFELRGANMAKSAGQLRKIGLVASAAALALTPSVVLAVAASSLTLDSIDPFGTFTPAGVDSKLAEHFDLDSLTDKSGFAFTPAGGLDAERSVMIVVRAPSAPTSDLVVVRKSLLENELGAAPSRSEGVKLAAMSYDLGAAKGLQSFALPEKAVRRKNDEPLVSVSKGTGFTLDDEPKKRSIAPRISVEEGRNVSAVPRDVAGVNDYKVDVGGRVSVTNGIDLTAGVRLENDRSQDQRLTNDQRDNQAVYVGTMIKF